MKIVGRWLMDEEAAGSIAAFNLDAAGGLTVTEHVKEGNGAKVWRVGTIRDPYVGGWLLSPAFPTEGEARRFVLDLVVIAERVRLGRYVDVQTFPRPRGTASDLIGRATDPSGFRPSEEPG